MSEGFVCKILDGNCVITTSDQTQLVREQILLKNDILSVDMKDT
jgi:hypothetical protein